MKLSDSSGQTKKPICKNCVRFEWTRQYCPVVDQYLEDDDTCPDYRPSWEEVVITEKGVGSAAWLFKNNSSSTTIINNDNKEGNNE